MYTFETTDCFNLKAFGNRLENFIQVEHDYVDGSLVLALNAAFGSGKTTFIEMWRHSLLQKREKGEAVPMPVVINAWENDHCGDPLLAILAGLTETIEQWKGPATPDKSKIIEAAKDVGWFTLGIANEFAANLAGFNPIEAAKLAEEKKDARSIPTPDFITRYRQRIDALKNLKEALNAIFSGGPPKILIFVDELDRCRPDYAVTFLETIKHVFDTPGMVFILAVDLSQLEHSIKALYGSIDFHEYFRKFAHRTISLPAIESNHHMNLARQYIKKYINIEGKRISKLRSQSNIIERITELSSGLKMRPRQIQESFRILGHATQTDQELFHTYWQILISTIMLCFIKTSHPETFSQIKESDKGIIELCKLAKKTFNDNSNWWIKVILSMASPENQEHDFREAFLIDEGFIKEKSQFREFFKGVIDHYSSRRNELRQLSLLIDQAGQI